jgi:hypothetical protein
VVLENAEVNQAGASGTILHSERGEVIIRGTRFRDNGGTILTQDSKVEVRDSEIAGNDMPYGGALNIETKHEGNIVTLTNNRIGGNRLAEGGSGINIVHDTNFGTLVLDIQRNLVLGSPQDGPNLLINTKGNINGKISCNSLAGASLGLSLRTDTSQVPEFNLQVFDNLIDEHVPPIIPEYLKYGIGRGAVSDIMLDMRNNWWGDPSGPYHPEQNPQGRGESAGSNVTFEPWLDERPSCVPLP